MFGIGDDLLETLVVVVEDVLVQFTDRRRVLIAAELDRHVVNESGT